MGVVYGTPIVIVNNEETNQLAETDLQTINSNNNLSEDE